MKLLKQVGHKHEDNGEAQDALAGISGLPGFVFGYVDDKENRCVTFHEVSEFERGPLGKGQQIVEVQLGTALVAA